MSCPEPEHPRFVCRREGHVPAIRVTITKAVPGASVPFYCTTCSRCGAPITVPLDPLPPSG